MAEKKQRKRIRTKAGTYMKLRQRNSPKGRRGQIKGRWSPKKKD